MTSRKLLILSLAALIAVGAGVWLAARHSSSGADEQALLYPDLKQQLSAVQAVRIFKAGEARAVEIVRNDDAWTVTERAGYPADAAKLRKLLRSLADAKLLEEKTSNPESYKSLGVEDVKTPDASGVRIEASGAPTQVNVVVGKSGPGSRSHYVRRAGEQQSWLIDEYLDTSATPDAWLRKEILDVSADRIQSATVTIETQKPYTAAKSSRADADFAVAQLPKGKQLASPSAANGVASALTSLTLTDVQPASAFAGVAPAAGARFTTFDGLIVELQGWKRDDKRFIAVKTSHDPQLAERFKPAAEAEDKKQDAADKTGAPSDKRADAAKAQEKQPNAAEEAKTSNARLAGWVYEIPEYKYELMFKPLEELL